jgi:stress response protein SCP2
VVALEPKEKKGGNLDVVEVGLGWDVAAVSSATDIDLDSSCVLFDSRNNVIVSIFMQSNAILHVSHTIGDCDAHRILSISPSSVMIMELWFTLGIM